MENRIPTSLLLLSLVVSGIANPSHASDWPQFRGLNGSGVAVKASPPTRLDPEQGFIWKIAVPWSPSSLSFSDDAFFLCTFADGDLETRCYRKADGKLNWSKKIRPQTLEVFHRLSGSPAASTPAIGLGKVVSYFGSYGVICYDLEGRFIWEHRLPVARSGGYGTGISPVIDKNRVVIGRDQSGGGSSLLCLNLETGAKLWEANRAQLGSSFGTPVIWQNEGVKEVVVCSSSLLKAYDLESGREHWTVSGLTGYSCTTPVIGEGMLIYAGWSNASDEGPFGTWEDFLKGQDKNHDGRITFEAPAEANDFLRGLDLDYNGAIEEKDFNEFIKTKKYRNTMVAVKPGGEGDITDSHVVWKQHKGLPYVASPLYYRGRVYTVRDGGMVSCFNAKTGNAFYAQKRLNNVGGSYFASPVAADNKVYYASQQGVVTVTQADCETLTILHQADFKEPIFASPAIVNDVFYLRTKEHVFAFQKR